MSTLSEQDVAGIKALVEEWNEIVRAEDWDRELETLTDDVVFMPPDVPALEGKDAIKEWLDGFPPIKAFNTVFVDAEGRDDFACARGKMTMTVEPESGKLLSMSCQWICSFRKQADGRWLCVWDTWNMDEPPKVS
jgi:ketosteroid isomerase-like protein